MDWLEHVIDSLASSLDADASTLTISAEERRLLLAVARTAAHTSGDRTNAPLLCYVLGRLAERGVAVDSSAAVFEQVVPSVIPPVLPE